MSGVSLLTIVKNRAAHLAQLIAGVRRSSFQPDEVIVVDMSDEPVTIEAGALPIRLIRHETDGLPLAAARNLAAQSSKGARLVFLDVDCIPLATMIGDVAGLLEREDSLVCAEVRYLGAGDERVVWDDASLLAAGASHPVRDFPRAGVRTETNPGLFWSLAFGIRRARFEALGGFDERFAGYGAEDTDFGFRAATAGLPLRFLGGAIACHQHHATYDPPLQHFDDIVANARLFHDIWGRWPMEGWLARFQSAGLIRWTSDGLDTIRGPSRAEIGAALVA
ncbi:glycosyltransferase [Sphingomonas sp. BIUV-7]|uniref:Glycosyltransferase n=1 Tax=Sphingomonas natans TaxID=3063330 RepID=A0ABT8Y9T6_9SPHN|nr:glycosyltransferase [Sphingomonas sp. BIUV-7]MDO6415098.1 glycosyltransferase [Sphingomonas sp. BIUV-7]